MTKRYCLFILAIGFRANILKRQLALFLVSGFFLNYHYLLEQMSE